jgi:hypothetical protein
MEPAGDVRKGPYKLIEWYDLKKVELYDLAADITPEEDGRTTNTAIAGAIAQDFDARFQ